jgi:hypothetical protein
MRITRVQPTASLEWSRHRPNGLFHLTPVSGFHEPCFLRDVTISPM